MNLDDQARAIALWQQQDHVHPLTCGNDSRHALLVPEKESGFGQVSLVCPTCGWRQSASTIPACVFMAWFDAEIERLSEPCPICQGTKPDCRACVGTGRVPKGFGMVDRLQVQATEIERLQAIVDKLPVTEDGIIVMPGMLIYRLAPPGWGGVEIAGLGMYLEAMAMSEDDSWKSVGKWYSTVEAAQAAGGTNDNRNDPA